MIDVPPPPRRNGRSRRRPRCVGSSRTIRMISSTVHDIHHILHRRGRQNRQHVMAEPMSTSCILHVLVDVREIIPNPYQSGQVMHPILQRTTGIQHDRLGVQDVRALHVVPSHLQLRLLPLLLTLPLLQRGRIEGLDVVQSGDVVREHARDDVKAGVQGVDVRAREDSSRQRSYPPRVLVHEPDGRYGRRQAQRTAFQLDHARHGGDVDRLSAQIVTMVRRRRHHAQLVQVGDRTLRETQAEDQRLARESEVALLHGIRGLTYLLGQQHQPIGVRHQVRLIADVRHGRSFVWLVACACVGICYVCTTLQ